MTTRYLSNIQKEQIQFDLSDFTSGTYMMSIDTNLGHTVQRFVVK
jgi:hypothetical protein